VGAQTSLPQQCKMCPNNDKFTVPTISKKDQIRKFKPHIELCYVVADLRKTCRTVFKGGVPFRFFGYIILKSVVTRRWCGYTKPDRWL